MRFSIYTTLCVLLLVSCTGQGKRSSETENSKLSNIIDLTAGFNNIQTIRLSEIADSVTFIPFETTAQSLQGQGQKFINFSSKYIFFLSMAFDWNGKYCGTIIKRGQGPFEEPTGGTLIYKDNHFYSKGSKFIEYDLTGKPTGKVRNLYSTEVETNDFVRGSTSFSSVGENFIIYVFPTTLYYIDRDFETVSSRIVVHADSVPPYIPPIGDYKYVTYYKEKVLFYNFINDTIFYVTDTSLDPQWIVDFDQRLRLPTQAILNAQKLIEDVARFHIGNGTLDNSELVKLTDNKHKVIDVYETESYLFFRMTEIIPLAVPRNKQPTEPYIIQYYKNTGKTTRVQGKGFVDDLLGMDFFYPQLGIYDEKMITYIWPFELINYIEECKNRGREVNSQLLGLSKQVKEDDNPILILVHLKK